MPPREEFPTGKAEGAPSEDIGWHFGRFVPGKSRNSVQCKFCGRVLTGGVTRLKEHLAHMQGEVKGCARVSTFVRENMMKLLLDNKAKKIDFRKRKEELVARLRGDEDDDIEGFLDEDRVMRQATEESIISQRHWEDMQRFRQQTGRLDSIYEGGGSSHAGGSSGASRQHQPSDLERRLRSVDVDLARSKSMKQTKINTNMMKTLRNKLAAAVSKLIIYERLPMNLCNSPWLHILLTEAAELGPGVKFPTSYEVSEVYLEKEYQSMRQYIDHELKPTWKERGVTIMCDGWTNSINHMHIMNFLVYCSNGTVFLKSIDASNVPSRNTDYYFKLLDKAVEEVGEDNVVQVVTDNEKALKAAGLKLMEKRPHLYWSACAAHCLDLCLEDIGKKSNVQKILEDAKKVTLFIYNHIWTVNLMKKYTGGREIIRPAITRFATQFLQVESIMKQKHALRNMFESEEFRKSKWGKEKSGPAYEAKKIILSKDFWSKASDIIKVFEPIVKVLRLVDGDDKPTMGFVYEAIDRAKQSIQKNCRYYTQYNDIIDKRWFFMHSDLHAAGYFLNPQFQFGVEHGRDVARETLDGTTKVISKLEANIDNQIKAINQLLLFRDKKETFGTTQAQRAWSQMNPAEWWMIYGSCTPELQRIAIKVLSQITSASNCERNWSTFSYIHTKTRNRLKYQKLQKLVFTFYNMKLRKRDSMRRSQEEIDASFNPINLDYIFQDEDPLSPWLEEREGPLLDGIQNSEWLPIDSDDDGEGIIVGDDSDSSETPSQGHDSGSSPPSNNTGNGGNAEQSQGGGEGSYHSFQEEPYFRRDQNLMIDMTNYRMEIDVDPSDDIIGGSSRGGSQPMKNRRRENTMMDDSSSSSVSQSFGDFGIGASFEGNQDNYPPYYQHPSYMSHGYYPPMSAPPYYQSSMNYQEPYQYPPSNVSYDQQQQMEPPRNSGFFDYVFGGLGNNDNQSESGGYDPARHSTMW